MAEVEFVSSTDNEFNGIMSGYGMKPGGATGNGGFHRVNFESGRDCGSPSRIEDALVYKWAIYSLYNVVTCTNCVCVSVIETAK